jgi:hypothetical protein
MLLDYIAPGEGKMETGKSKFENRSSELKERNSILEWAPPRRMSDAMLSAARQLSSEA